MSTSAVNPAAPKTKEKRRCRSLTVAGLQCRATALHGRDFCVKHDRFRHPRLPSKFELVVIPLLEDHASIQLLATQVAQGLLADSITPQRAGKILYACQVAAFTLPRPPRMASPAPESQPVIQEPVSEVTTGPDGDLLGPDEKYVGPQGSFEPYWSFSKYLYEQECEKLGIPKPTCAEDMPPSGWMDEAEYKDDADEWFARYAAKIAALSREKKRREAEESAAAIAAGLPDPHAKRPCVRGKHDCEGPDLGGCCQDCREIAQEEEKQAAQAAWAAAHPGQTLGDLKAAAEPEDAVLPPAPCPRPPSPRLLLSNSLTRLSPTFHSPCAESQPGGVPPPQPHTLPPAVAQAARLRSGLPAPACRLPHGGE